MEDIMRRLIAFFVVVAGLLLFSQAIHAQGGSEFEHYRAGLQSERRSSRSDTLAGDVVLGETGLAFRYVTEYGVSETAYIEDGSHLYDPNSVTIDNAGNIWISEWHGRRTAKFDKNGQFLFSLGKAGFQGGNREILGAASDTQIDKYGNIWVSQPERHTIVKFNSAGEYQSELGHEMGHDNEHFYLPRGLAFDTHGNLYVCDELNHRIQIFGNDGSYLTTLGESGVPGDDNGHFKYPVNPYIADSKLYVADGGNHRIQVFDISNPHAISYLFTLGVTGAPGSDNMHFNGPTGIAVGNGRIFVADMYNNRIQIFDATSHNYLATIGAGVEGSNPGEFKHPFDVDVDADGNIYVSEYAQHRVQKFDANYQYVSMIGVTNVPYVVRPGYYNTPAGLALTPDGGLIVVEKTGQRIIKLNPDGTEAWTFGVAGVFGNDAQHFDDPKGVAVGADGRIFVTEIWNDRIHIVNPDGTHGGFWGKPGNGDYELNGPHDIAFDNAGRVYIADTYNHRVQIYDRYFRYITTLGVTGESGNDNAHFNAPRSVAVDSAGTIYVGDSDNDRVQIFDKHFVYQRTIGGHGCTDSFEGFCGTYGLTVDGQNRLYVADTWNNRVQVFDQHGAYLTTISGKWGGGLGEARAVYDVAVSPDNTVFFTDTENHRIYKYALGVPGWTQINLNGFGKRENWAAWALGKYNGVLYAGTANHHTGAEVYRYVNDQWEKVADHGFGDDTNKAIDRFTEFKGRLYASTWNEGNGAQIWRSPTGDSGSWTKSSGGFSDGANMEVMSLTTFNGYLYAGTWVYDLDTHGAEIWRSATGDSDSWEKVLMDSTIGHSNTEAILTMTVFKDALFAATVNKATGGEIWRSTDGAHWQQVNADGFGNGNNVKIVSLEVFSNRLYAGTLNNETGGEIWRTEDGSHWTRVMKHGFGKVANKDIASLIVFDEQLYAIIGNFQTGPEIWRSSTGDPNSWEKLIDKGFGGGKAATVNWDNTAIVLDDQLYIAAFAGWGNGGGRIWQRLPRQLFLPMAIRR